MGHDQEDTQIIMMPSKAEEGEKAGVSVGGKDQAERDGAGVQLCVLCLNLHPNEGTCVRCHAAKRSPVSGGGYQAKTRASSAGAHSHSLILLRCTLKQPSSGAKPRQPCQPT